MWLLAIAIGSLLAGLILGPILAQAAEEQTFDPALIPPPVDDLPIPSRLATPVRKPASAAEVARLN